MALGARMAVRAASTCGRSAVHGSMVSRGASRWQQRPAWGRQIHATTVAWKDDAPKEEETMFSPAGEDATPFEKEIDESEQRPGPDGTPQPMPGWQNPRHHSDPTKMKVFLDEFEEGEKPEPATLPPFGDGSGKVNAGAELNGIAEEIVSMNMLEVKDLVDRIGKHFGLEEVMLGGGPPAAGGGGGEGGGDAEEKEKEEQTAFDVKLTGFDAKAKIKVIKEVRAAAGLGLKEAKDLVEGAPKTVMKGLKKEEAEELKAKLEAVGGTAEVV